MYFYDERVVFVLCIMYLLCSILLAHSWRPRYVCRVVYRRPVLAGRYIIAVDTAFRRYLIGLRPGLYGHKPRDPRRQFIRPADKLIFYRAARVPPSQSTRAVLPRPALPAVVGTLPIGRARPPSPQWLLFFFTPFGLLPYCFILFSYRFS